MSDINYGELIKAVKRNLVLLKKELRNGDLPKAWRHLNSIIDSFDTDVEKIKIKEQAEDNDVDYGLKEVSEAHNPEEV